MAGIDWINKNVAYISNAIDNQELLTENIEPIDKYRKVRVYPFRIVSGTQLLTKAGEVDILTNINKEGQYANFYTGNDQITIVWEGSTTLNANSYISNNQIVEELKVGRYIDLLASDEGLLSKANNISSVNLYGIDYTTTETQNGLTLWCDCSEDEYETNKVWSFIDRDSQNQEFIASSYVPTDYDIQNYVYLILDPRYQSYQWLRIKNVVYSYNNSTRKPISALIEFETINNDFTNTGKSILQYFQNGTPNESYAFPIESYDEEGNTITDIDISLIQREGNLIEGVESIQLDFMGGYALSSVGILGRPVEEDSWFEKNYDTYTRKIKTPQWLLLLRSERLVESPFINRLPVQNVFAAYDMYNDVRGVYKSYQEAYGAQTSFGGYNVTATKQVITGMRPKSRNWSDVINTNAFKGENPSTSSIVGLDDLTVYETGKYSYNNWYSEGNLNDNWIKPVIQKEYVNGVPNFTAGNSANNASLPQFLNQNHVINWGIEELTTNYTESTKYNLTSALGILGNIFSTLTNGLDIGWIKNKTIQDGQTYNVLLPTEIIENARATHNLNKDNALPLDYFNDQLATKMLPVNSNLYTAYRFTLTHLFKYNQSNVNTDRPSYNKEGGGKDNIWDTKYLGQSRDEEGYYLLTDQTEFKPDIYQMEPIASNQTYLIDWLNTKGIGICDKRISMYRSVYNDFTESYIEKSVYQLIAQTKSKVKNNITLWSDSIKFNYYDEFNTFGHVDWPKQNIPKTPDINVVTNQQLQIDPKLIWEKQITNVGGSVKGNPQYFSNILQSSFGALTSAPSSIDNARAWNRILAYYTDTPQQFANNEAKLQQLSNISNFKEKNTFTKDTSVSGEYYNNHTKWEQEFDMSNLSWTLDKDNWAKEDTLSNMRVNLEELSFNIYLKDILNTPNLQNEAIAPYTITLTSEELRLFLTENKITKELDITFNDIPNSFSYPIGIGADYWLPLSYQPMIYRTVAGGAVLSYSYGLAHHYGTWYWLTNPNRIFNNSILTYDGNVDKFAANKNIAFNTTANTIFNVIDENQNKMLDNWYSQTTGLKDISFNFQNYGYDSQYVVNSINYQNRTYKNTGRYGIFQNYKPTCIDPTKTLNLTATLELQIVNSDKLQINLKNIHVHNTYSGLFNFYEAKKAFNGISSTYDVGELDSKDRLNYPISNSNDTVYIIKDERFKDTQNNAPKSYAYACNDASVFLSGAALVSTSYYSGRTTLDYKNPTNYTYKTNAGAIDGWFDACGKYDWTKYYNYNNYQSGDKTGQSQFVQNWVNAVAGDFNSFINEVDTNTTENIFTKPMTMGFKQSSQRQFFGDNQKGIFNSYCLSYQYDDIVSFRPTFAFSFTPKWKS